MSWLRTEGEMPEIDGHPWVRESPTFHRLEPSNAIVCRKHPIRVRKTRGLDVFLD
jgi:hypothetical protein